MTDKPLKSAFELAMERLARQDQEAGVAPQTLSDEQKAAIAEVRSVYEAKLAELDVLHQSRMRTTPDPEARAVRDEEFRRERERLTSERDTKVARIRTGNGENG